MPADRVWRGCLLCATPLQYRLFCAGGAPEANIVLYQDDGRNVPVQMRYEGETFWLTQKDMAELFGVDVRTVSEHLKNIYDSGELVEEATIRKNRIVRQEGARKVRREVVFYNLDAIIAVCYRVNSKRATKFRQWATGVLRESMPTSPTWD